MLLACEGEEEMRWYVVPNEARGRLREYDEEYDEDFLVTSFDVIEDDCSGDEDE